MTQLNLQLTLGLSESYMVRNRSDRFSCDKGQTLYYYDRYCSKKTKKLLKGPDIADIPITTDEKSNGYINHVSI